VSYKEELHKETLSSIKWLSSSKDILDERREKN